MTPTFFGASSDVTARAKRAKNRFRPDLITGDYEFDLIAS